MRLLCLLLCTHPSFSFFIISISKDDFFPQKRGEPLVSMQSSGSTNSTLLNEIFMTIDYLWVRGIERDEDENSCHFGHRPPSKFPVSAASLRTATLFFLHLLALWTWRTDSKNSSSSPSTCFKLSVFLLFLSSSSVLFLLLLRRLSLQHCWQKLCAGRKAASQLTKLKVNEMQNSFDVMELLHYGGDATWRTMSAFQVVQPADQLCKLEFQRVSENWKAFKQQERKINCTQEDCLF